MFYVRKQQTYLERYSILQKICQIFAQYSLATLEQACPKAWGMI